MDPSATALEGRIVVTEQANLEERIRELIERIWGFSTLRPLQAEAIEAGLNGQDSLVVMPTGGGKSLCYQAPPLVAGRMDVVVSPLISLMKDQVDALQSNGYPAAAIYGGLDEEDRRRIATQVQSGDLHLLFVAPERLMNARFLDFLARAGVSSFAIDEAHCISHWGHDFRPEYRRLVELRTRFPDASFHAFTATATERVRDDIVAQLGLREPRVLVGNFDRPNLVYRMVPRVGVREQVLEVIRRHDREAVIVYCISRKETESLAGHLKRNGANAAAYHAGMEPDARRQIQDAFAQERLDVVVATVAFGMGIDRSNVRCVVHAAMPKSIEHYQQETGRAGRDGLEAECVLFYSQADVIRWERLITESAAEAERPDDVINAMRELLVEMQKLASGSKCRHRSLVEYFGQTYDQSDCGACDVCLNELDVIDDSTTVAQKIISCVARVKERFGVGHVAEVLTGGKSEQVRKYRHDGLSVHGLLNNLSKKQVMNLANQLIDQGWLSRTEGQYVVVTLNDRSAEVLRGNVEVKLVKPGEAPTRRTRAHIESWEGVDQGLFERLRELRRRTADERNVPAYVIFGDATLRDLARCRPGSVESMRHVYGVGAKKRNEFGERFISEIRDFCAENGLKTDCVVVPSPRTRRTSAATQDGGIPGWKLAVFDRFRAGDSIEDVMQLLGRARGTVGNYLVEFIEHDRPESVATWVNAGVYRRVAEAVDRVGSSFLKPIHEDLNGGVDYESIKLVVAHRELKRTPESDST